MTTADQLSIVSSFLGDDALAVSLAEGGLVQGWMKARRMLVVAKKGQGHVFFVFVSTSFPLSAKDNLTVETSMAIDAEFKCEIDSGEAVLIKISGGSRPQLMFEMMPGYHTQNFVGEIFKQTSEASKLTETDFAWAAKYQKQEDPSPALPSLASGLEKLTVGPLAPDATAASSSNDPTAAPPVAAAAVADPTGGLRDMMESPDSSLNRQEIAMGVTPIAARESVVKYQMQLKEDQFTHLQTFTLFVGTWNVNGQSPQPDISEWLGQDEEAPDLYVIGFQELDLSKEAFVFNDSLREEEWKKTVANSLHPKAKYKKVKLVRLVGMMLIVLVKADHIPFIKNVTAETVGTGIMGKLGNKGGVAIRLEFHNTSICFVNSHLAAHVSECERRNQDFHDICSRMSFTQFSPAKAIKDHDMVYWLGDLNYRITDLDASAVKEILKEKKDKKENDFSDLLLNDQFNQQKLMRKIFTGYSEGEINFIPTYKFDPGTNDWDSSEKGRAPAWTDRVLWKGDHIQQSEYRSHMGLKISDHKPVSAIFKSGMKVVDPAKYRKIYEEVMKKLDRLENEFLPQVTVETTEINFDTIRFTEPCTKTLTVANTGQVPVQFEFIKKLNDKSFCKPWLHVEPSTGFIMPGDKSDIALEIFVDKKTAGPLTSGQDQMYDILVLHLIGGKDIFVTVSGVYQKSSFGASINALCKMTVPISDLSAGQLMELEGTKKSETETKKEEEAYPVPKELWFLCDLITSLGLQMENLFLQPGLRAEVLAIRDWLDTGLPVGKPNVSIHSAAETLMLFLESLREPIVPYNMYSQCLDSSPNYLQCKQIAAQLPFHHKQVFNYMTAFLREVVKHSAQNGIDPKILATLFSGIFLRDPPGTNLGSGIKARTHQQLLDHRKARYIYHFLVNEPDD